MDSDVSTLKEITWNVGELIALGVGLFALLPAGMCACVVYEFSKRALARLRS